MPKRGFNHLPAVIRALPTGAEAVVQKAVIDIAAGAAAAAPIDTGALAQSYTFEVEGDTGWAGSNMEYAPYVEYGTVRSAAQPHLLPAADRVERSARQMARQLGLKVEKAARDG